ncbi:hypothetical protein Taro_046855 [Colocasia esculenta]|uniref:Uncharacterized protein n=1 Tax=Colocasia esculenta TaxID=4460 RepID=A0A843X315_COLES|nr:hypothetical protein [Colocasia esculenta]
MQIIDPSHTFHSASSSGHHVTKEHVIEEDEIDSQDYIDNNENMDEGDNEPLFDIARLIIHKLNISKTLQIYSLLING